MGRELQQLDQKAPTTTCVKLEFCENRNEGDREGRESRGIGIKFGGEWEGESEGKQEMQEIDLKGEGRKQHAWTRLGGSGHTIKRKVG